MVPSQRTYHVSVLTLANMEIQIGSEQHDERSRDNRKVRWTKIALTVHMPADVLQDDTGKSENKENLGVCGCAHMVLVIAEVEEVAEPIHHCDCKTAAMNPQPQ